MSAVQRPLPRSSLGWLLAAQLSLLLPHLGRLPFWVWGVFLVAAGWRWAVYSGRAALPGRWLTLLLVLAGFAGTGASYGTWLGLEATTALLFIAASLKILEARSHRDAWVLVLLGFFLLMTAFLFEQAVWLALYAGLPLWLLASGLFSLHGPGLPRGQVVARSGVLLLQALPIMLLLFLVAPRFAPLWSVPQQTQAGVTGMSNVMTPGDVARLSGSDRLAFRVRFREAPPERAELYWRGLVFGMFDGRSWRPLSETQHLLLPQPDADRLRGVPGTSIDYQVMLEPTHQRWVFTLDVPVIHDGDFTFTRDFRLVASTPVRERRLIDLGSNPAVPAHTGLSDMERHLYRHLPAAGNPRARQLAAGWRSGMEQPRQRVEAALRLFREEAFHYTLQPSLLGRDSVDEFLFETRQGFCEHYAGAFVFLMRAAGVPARVVAGYQGGEINPLTGTVLVHDYDAHAWAEVWLEGAGWVRVDPTAAVAPERILDSLQAALAGEFRPGGALSPSRYRHIDWVNRLRLRLDAFEDYWTRWVLAYRGDRQWQALERLLGAVTPWRLSLFLVAGSALLLGLVGWRLAGPPWRRERDPGQRLYRRFERRLARLGYPREPAMAPGTYARWLASQQPDWAAAVLAITRCYERLRYQAMHAAERAAAEADLRRRVQAFRPRRTRPGPASGAG